MRTKKEKKKIILQAPKGMHDILPEEYPYFQNIYDKAEEIASYYGFQPIMIPHLERTEIFTSGVGELTDIVEKEMYSFKTRGGDNLSLRPEFTAGIMRAYLEHGMHTLPQPVMLWYKGSVFRHENPQKNRFREFRQWGIEVLGEEKPIAETMIIQVIYLILNELGVGPIKIEINSLGDRECRPKFRKDLINYYRKRANNLCSDCKRRLKDNPLRVLDCKEEKCKSLKEEAPKMADYLCDGCKKHFMEVLESLDLLKIPYVLNDHLVRGLDYYTRSVFEFMPQIEMAEIETISTDTIAAGGRYDYLAKFLGKKEVPAAGASLGVERIVQLMKEKNIAAKQKRRPKIFLIQIGISAKNKSFNIIEAFRKAKIPLSQSISKDSLRGQLNLASKLGVNYSLIFGQKESIDNTIIIRDMNTGSQEIVPLKDVVEIIRKKLSAGN